MASFFCLVAVLFLLLSQESQSVFILEPESVIIPEGLTATFDCDHTQSHSYSWYLNGSLQYRLPFGISAITPTDDSLKATLSITALEEYNNTIVQCNVIANDNGIPLFIKSKNASLLIQGRVMSVPNIQVSSSPFSELIIISWTPPFSLNISVAEPDVEYCLEVFNVTGQIRSLSTFCTLELMVLYRGAARNDRYGFTVTPRNNLEQALAGSVSEMVLGSFGSLIMASNLISYHTTAMLVPIQWRISSLIINTTEELRLATEFSVHLDSIDDIHHAVHCNCPAFNSLVFEDSIEVSLQYCQHCIIERHRVYSYKITIKNQIGEFTSNGNIMSTHDGQGVSIGSDGDSVVINCSYLDGSTPSGLFVLAQSTANTSDVYYSGSHGNTSCAASLDMPQGVYRVLVFDRGTDGLPESWPAAGKEIEIKPKTSEYLESNVTTTSSFLVTVEQNIGEICVNCSVLNTVFNACVVVIHSPLNNITSIFQKTLDVFIINESDELKCFQIPEKDYYNIAVFGVLPNGVWGETAFHTHFERPEITPLTTRESTPGDLPTNSSPNVVLLGTLFFGGISSTCIVLIILILVYISKKNRKRTIKNQTFGVALSKGSDDLIINQFYGMTKELSRKSSPCPDHTYEELVLRRPGHGDREKGDRVYDEPKLVLDVKPTDTEQGYIVMCNASGIIKH